MSVPETKGEQETGNPKKDIYPEETPGESSTEINSLAGGNQESDNQTQLPDKSVEPDAPAKNLKIDTNTELTGEEPQD